MIGLDLCPFARVPEARGLVHLREEGASEPAPILTRMLAEATLLDQAGEGTTLLVLPAFHGDFGHFLHLFYRAEDLLEAAGFARKVQVMAFHPDWVFEGAPPEDPANAVQRSPLPLLHLIRWADVHEAIDAHKDIGQVAVRNARLLRQRAGWAVPGPDPQ